MTEFCLLSIIKIFKKGTGSYHSIRKVLNAKADKRACMKMLHQQILTESIIKLVAVQSRKGNMKSVLYLINEIAAKKKSLIAGDLTGFKF